METLQPCIFWFRRDLRFHDNAGLFKALKSGRKVIGLFIFDEEILSKLGDKKDARVNFIHAELVKMKAKLEAIGSSMVIEYGKPQHIWPALIEKYSPSCVYVNRDYEPYAKLRDQKVHDLLTSHKVEFVGAKDHVIFEKSEVVKDNGEPYSVFTPYMRKWKAKLTPTQFNGHPSEEHMEAFQTLAPLPLVSLSDMGFDTTEVEYPSLEFENTILSNYEERRDIPSVKGTTRVSLHLRFGTLSIRELARRGQQHSEKWLNELIWRDFYQMIIHHHPHTVDNAFKPKYDRVEWINDEGQFEKWCQGKTGYPIVDAGMRELNATGFMHNRVRMITASFLVKHLLVDWRWGERYFAEKLLDFELASNVGGWQWAASSGCDAAPYFRVFNPTSQHKKFDPENKYIKRWVPEYGTSSYPEPIVDHKMARERVLLTYKSALAD